MPASKKDLRRKDQKAAEANGTRAKLTQSGVPVKAAKPTVQCAVCKMVLVKEQAQQLKDHASNKHPKQTFEQCFTL